jgi:hypothetical protein
MMPARRAAIIEPPPVGAIALRGGVAPVEKLAPVDPKCFP